MKARHANSRIITVQYQCLVSSVPLSRYKEGPRHHDQKSQMLLSQCERSELNQSRSVSPAQYSTVLCDSAMYTGWFSSEPRAVEFDFFFGETSAIASGFCDRSSIPAVLCPFKCFVFSIYTCHSLFRNYVTIELLLLLAPFTKKFFALPYCIIAVGGTPPLWHQPAGSSGYKLKLIPK